MTKQLGFVLVALVGALAVSCSRGDGGGSGSHSGATTAAPALQPPTVPNWSGGPADVSQSVVTRHPQTQVAYPTVSAAFRDIPPAAPIEEKTEHEPLRNPFPFAPVKTPDPVLQTFSPISQQLMAIQNFVGQGETLGGCIFPRPDMGEPAGCTTTGDPPDTNGVVGPNHFVQTVNGGIGIWSKTGTVVLTPRYLKTLWTGYVGTNAGNACATQNDGDPVVLYDQLADRWFVTQFSLPNYDAGTGPSFQCVAVSQTGDPTGAYNLYDFQYSAQINDYGKFGVWPDAYYASFNMFGGATGATVCAYDRAKMLAGQPATQQCFAKSSLFGLLPSNLDGMIKPPNGEPGFFVTLKNGTSISLYKFHVDWTTPASSTFTGPTNIMVPSYNQLCGGGSCVPQKSPGNTLASLGDRPMFHLSYRNFGTLESLVFNHSITGGPRWYEIRSPNGTPVLFQSGTFAPDNKSRWMGSISQDQAQDIALGYSVSSSTATPAIGWTGRVATDAAGVMGQGETIVSTGPGVETGTFSDGSTAERWGDYSNMSVDPTDDCTFWYTQEQYPANGVFNWDTGIASAKFANCAQNDFTISLSPAMRTVAQGGTATYTVTTTVKAGAAETIQLVVEDLPTGVTGAFVPASVTAGMTSTLTLTATAAAPMTGTPAPTFMVIGKAPSACHAATAQIAVGNCVPATTCPSGDNCGTVDNGCGGTVSCGPACTAPQTCGGGGMPNVCGCTPSVSCPAGANCGSVDNGCGTMVSCGAACTPDQTCVSNVCTANPHDMSVVPTPDLSVPVTNDLSMAAGDDLSSGGGGGGGGGAGGGGGGGGKGGCSCDLAGRQGTPAPWGVMAVMLVLGGGLLRRRRTSGI